MDDAFSRVPAFPHGEVPERHGSPAHCSEAYPGSFAPASPQNSFAPGSTYSDDGQRASWINSAVRGSHWEDGTLQRSETSMHHDDQLQVPKPPPGTPERRGTRREGAAVKTPEHLKPKQRLSSSVRRQMSEQ